MKAAKSPAVFLAAALAAAVLFPLWFNGLDAPPAGAKGGDLILTQGLTDRRIAARLERYGFIRSRHYFLHLLRVKGAGGRIQAGEYRLPPGSTSRQTLEHLLKGPVNRFVKLTVPEGFTLKDIARRVGARTRCGEGEFLTLVSGPAFLGRAYGEMPAPPGPEGYLFPETYQIDRDRGCEDIAGGLARQFVREALALDLERRAAAAGLTLHEAVTLASMIEWEAKAADERPVISSVYHNRLKKNMPLQCDATVQYALPERRSRLLYKDLEVDSPYNTYRHRGLPPGPIGAPGRASLDAAVSPSGDPWLYYVAGPDGRHVFTRTLPEHNRAVARVRAGRK